MCSQKHVAAAAKIKGEVAHIVHLLQRLKYSGVECTEEAWVHRLLLEPGEPREELLLWLLMMLAPADLLQHYEETKGVRHATNTNKLLHCLSSLGLCRPTDGALLEGRVVVWQLLQLWRLLLGTVCGRSALHRLGPGPVLQRRCGDLLHALCGSAAVARVTKCDSSSVLPLDLQERYRAWCRHSKQQQPVAAMVEEAQLQLQLVGEEYDQVDQAYTQPPSAEQHSAALQRMQDRLAKVDHSGRLFGQVHSTHLAPWTTADGAADRGVLPDAGAAVHEAYTALDKLNTVLSSTAELLDKTEELQTAEASIQRAMAEPSAVCATVQRLVTTALL